MFGSAEAGKAALTLMKNGAEGFKTLFAFAVGITLPMTDANSATVTLPRFCVVISIFEDEHHGGEAGKGENGIVEPWNCAGEYILALCHDRGGKVVRFGVPASALPNISERLFPLLSASACKMFSTSARLFPSAISSPNRRTPPTRWGSWKRRQNLQRAALPKPGKRWTC